MQRLLNNRQAADYCGLSLPILKELPIKRREVKPGMHRYDRRDLDDWIDGLGREGETEKAKTCSAADIAFG